MAKTTVEVKQYKRKDGTVVRGSTRKLTKAEKLKRKQSLGNHIKKGAKISGAITGSLGALQGAAYGGALGGPVGALVGAGVGGATSAVGGAASGAGYGAGVYGVKRAMAKRRDPKGFKKSFDYSKNEENMMEFKRGKDKTKRKKRQNKLGGHVKKGAKIGATIGALNNAAGAAAMTEGGGGKKLAAALGGAAGGAISGGLGGATWGAGTYGAKKLLAKNRGKENFDYSRNIEDVKMFIGQQDESSINFARPKGAKDKMPRKKSGLRTAAKVGAGLAGAAAIGAAARYGGAGKAQMGLNRALKGSAMSAREKVGSFRQGAGNAVRSDVGSARQKVGGKLNAMGSKMQRKGAYDRQHAATDWDLTDREAIKQVKRANTRSAVGSKLRSVASKIRGN